VRRNAESEYQRVRQLYANDNASKDELDSSLANAESAIAAYEAAVQGVRLAELNVGYTRLTTESACTIAEVLVEANENVSNGQQVITASCGDGWEVVVDVPESIIADFTVGMAGVVSFTSVQGQAFSAGVSEISIGTSSSATFPVTFVLNDIPRNIRNNLAAEVSVSLPSAGFEGEAIYLPSTAVGQDQSGNFVYVIEPQSEGSNSVLNKRSITVGQLSNAGIEVFDGLQSGEQILVAGLANARDGLVVRAQD
jgi:RND family efflux transporter MFP subunit